MLAASVVDQHQACVPDIQPQVKKVDMEATSHSIEYSHPDENLPSQILKTTIS
jgi:hypothetical protein